MACELSARIVPGDGTCKQYRQSNSPSCRECTELNTSVVSQEVVVTEPKKLRKGDKFRCPVCKRDNAIYEADGVCGVCTTAIRKKKRSSAGTSSVKADHKPALPAGPVVKPSAEYPDLSSDAAEVKKGFGKVNNADGESVSFGVDPLVHMALRDAWYQVERKALESLSGLAPASALVRAANLVQRIQALEA
ncbi:hypothetical protein [Trichlorobacter lovleyi]|uniref:hypothetical protein n=1 Tax=Trichlorobacter lovleyi TaxID=313985 RepID=UPI003D0B583E